MRSSSLRSAARSPRQPRVVTALPPKRPERVEYRVELDWTSYRPEQGRH